MPLSMLSEVLALLVTVVLAGTTARANVPPPQLEVGLAHAFLKEPVDTSVNGFLINTGSKLLLIDPGTGGLFGPALGRLTANLTASGYQPEQVDEICITHTHGDQVGGLGADGQRVFPNAIVPASQTEADYWLSQAHMDAASKEEQGGFAASSYLYVPINYPVPH